MEAHQRANSGRKLIGAEKVKDVAEEKEEVGNGEEEKVKLFDDFLNTYDRLWRGVWRHRLCSMGTMWKYNLVVFLKGV